MMTQIDHYWSFVCEVGEQYLDCKLITASGTYFTNRCFLQLFSSLKIFDGEGDIIISMPEFCYSDVMRELNGYLTMRKTKSSNDQVLEPSSSFSGSDDINSQCLRLMEQEENKKQRKAKPKITSSKVKSPNADQESFQCDVCGLIFETSKKCRMHKYQVHSNSSFSCELCSNRFKTKSILLNHLKSHEPPSFPCLYCSKVDTIKKAFSLSIKQFSSFVVKNDNSKFNGNRQSEIQAEM